MLPGLPPPYGSSVRVEGAPGPNGEPAGTLTRALHLSRFYVAIGKALDPPAELPLASYDVVIEDGRVLIEIPDGPLPVNE